MQRFPTKVLREQLVGRWLDIFSRLTPELNRAITRLGQHVSCPVHGGKDGFRLFKDCAATGGGICNTCGAFRDGFALLQWLKGWRFEQVVDELGELLISGGAKLGHDKKNVSFVHSSLPSKRNDFTNNKKLNDDFIRQQLVKTWEGSLSLSSYSASIARRYLAMRGIIFDDYQFLDTSIRFHPKLPYFVEGREILGYYPGLVAKVVTESNWVTLQRIYLSPEGLKADVPIAKKMMRFTTEHSLKGAVVKLGQLAPHSKQLHLAEGIETALAVRIGIQQTVWSCVNTALLAGFVPPDSVRQVVVWVDADRNHAGEIAANKLAKRLKNQGVECIIHIPPMSLFTGIKSLDYNDVLNAYGKLGFYSAF